MGKYSVYIKPSAVKELEAVKLKKERQKIAEMIKQLSSDPRPAGCQKLSGQNRYRLRQGNYRILYEISENNPSVHIVKIAHRKDVYKKK